MKFLDRFSKNTQILKYFTKTHPVGTRLFSADRQTGKQAYLMMLKVAFHNFTNTPKMEVRIYHYQIVFSLLDTLTLYT
jgi:hypothetical protein